MKSRFALFLLLGIWLLSLPTIVWAAPSSHEIMLKIAAEQLVPVNGAICSVHLPKSWFVVLNSPTKLQFKVPYHPGVLGVIEKTNSVLSSDEAVKRLTDDFNSEFVVVSDEVYGRSQISGRSIVLNARLGGEKWKVLVFAGHLISGDNVFYYAVVPEYWFASYQPLLNDILESFQ